MTLTVLLTLTDPWGLPPGGGFSIGVIYEGECLPGVTSAYPFTHPRTLYLLSARMYCIQGGQETEATF